MLTSEEMIDMVLDIETEIKNIFGELTSKQKDCLLKVVSFIDKQITNDSESTNKQSSYQPNYYGLMVETYKQNKQFYMFDDVDRENKLKDYISGYNEYYYETVEDALPIHRVSEIDENKMFINSYIDIQYGYLND